MTRFVFIFFFAGAAEAKYLILLVFYYYYCTYFGCFLKLFSFNINNHFIIYLLISPEILLMHFLWVID